MQERSTKNGMNGWFILFLFFIFCIFLFLVIAAFFFLPSHSHGHAHDDDDNSYSHHRHRHGSGGGGKGGGSPPSPSPSGRFVVTGGGGEEEKLRFSGGVTAATEDVSGGTEYDLVEEVGVLLEADSASSLWTVDSIVVDGVVVGYSTSIGGEDDSGLVARTPDDIGSFPPPIAGAVPFCGVYEVSKPHQGISFYGTWPQRYVGINTKLPDTQLDVNGDAKVRGNLKVCGDLEVCGDFTLQNRTVFGECDAQQECQHLFPTNGCQLAVCLEEIGGDGTIHCLLKVDANEVGEPCDDGDDFTDNDECNPSGLCEGDHIHSQQCNATELESCGAVAQCRKLNCARLADGFVFCADVADLDKDGEECDDWNGLTVGDHCHEGACVAGTASPTPSPTPPTPAPTPSICAPESCPTGPEQCTNIGNCINFGFGGVCRFRSISGPSCSGVFGAPCDMGDCYCPSPDAINATLCAPPDPCAEAECPEVGNLCTDEQGTCLLQLGPSLCILNSLIVPSDCTVSGEPCDVGCSCLGAIGSNLQCTGGGEPPGTDCPAGNSPCGLGGGLICVAPKICCIINTIPTCVDPV